MKHLRQYIRQILLTERAIGPEDLHSENAIVYITQGYGDGIHIYYATREDVEPMNAKGSSYPLGEIWIEAPGTLGPMFPCDGAWMVSSSQAKEGWGPLLYDVAIEYATLHGKGLFADRGSVSGSARTVWDYYLNRRSDVDYYHMDDEQNTLTDIDEDNCDQGVATHPGEGGTAEDDFTKSPISKRYTKKPIIINKLKQLGLLVEL